MKSYLEPQRSSWGTGPTVQHNFITCILLRLFSILTLSIIICLNRKKLYYNHRYLVILVSWDDSKITSRNEWRQHLIIKNVILLFMRTQKIYLILSFEYIMRWKILYSCLNEVVYSL